MKANFFLSLMISILLCRQAYGFQLNATTPPTITATHTYNVTRESAEFNVEFLSHSLDTYVWFEIGKTEEYADSTPKHFFIGTSSPTISRSLQSNLLSSTVYHIRGVAENIHGRTYGTDYAFITSPPTVINLPATGITKHTALLHAQCNPHGQPTMIFFTIGIESTYNISSTATIFLATGDVDTEIVIPITELTPNTHYYARVIARNTTMPDVMAQGIPQSFTTSLDSNAAGYLVPLKFVTQKGKTTLLYFGVHSSATRCLDYSLGEKELPPPPPGNENLWARFTSTCFGFGTEIDLRQFYYPAQIDTYNIRVQGVPDEYPIIITWTKLDSLYDGEIFLFVTNEIVDMKKTISVTITDQDLITLTIITQQPHPIEHQPNVITRPPLSIGPSSTKVSYLVNSNGIETSAWCEWGTSDLYGNTTTHQQIGDSVRIVEINVPLPVLNPNTLYHYRAIAQNGIGISFGADYSFTTLSVTDSKENASPPQQFSLYQNYPNPFNLTTTITYTLPTAGYVTMTIFDALGRKQITAVNHSESAGIKTVHVNADKLSSGVYFYEFRTGNYRSVKKMILLK